MGMVLAGHWSGRIFNILPHKRLACRVVTKAQSGFDMSDDTEKTIAICLLPKLSKILILPEFQI
jgi:hypothetical protein